MEIMQLFDYRSFLSTMETEVIKGKLKYWLKSNCGIIALTGMVGRQDNPLGKNSTTAI